MSDSSSWINAAHGSLSGLAAISQLTATPTRPPATSATKTRAAEERFEKREKRLDEILPITLGRVVPDDEDLMIGDARRLKLAVLFLDICGFSKIDSEEDKDQDRVLKLLNLFMAEMLYVVREHGGTFEKNTGDGLMAYFGGGASDSTLQAVEAAVTMHHYNDRVISPRLRSHGLEEVRFRVGVETGRVTVANVGVRGDHHSLVALGNTANIACRLMELIPDGGIALGDITRKLLPEDWKGQTAAIGSVPGYVFRDTTTPYPAWELKYRAPALMDLGALFAATSALGGR